MLVMKIAGMGDLLTADLHTANHIAGRGAEHSNTQAVAVAELETYVVELDSSDMAEVLQVIYFVLVSFTIIAHCHRVCNAVMGSVVLRVCVLLRCIMT